MSSTNRKRSALAGLLVLLAITAGAIAYWSIGGSGTGTGEAGDVSAVTVNQVTDLDPMYPGDTAQTISGTFDNPNAGPVYISTVTASIASVTKASGAPAGTCDETDFTLASAAMTVATQIPAGDDQGAWTGATIKFNNKASNQDACKGATVNLSYAAA